MAITTVNMVYSGTGPTATNQIIAATQPGDVSRLLYGIATATGDAASSAFDVNFIDGTAVLPFTPSAVLCFRTGGAATSTIAVTGTSAITATKFTVNTSANVNAATFIVGIIVIK